MSRETSRWTRDGSSRPAGCVVYNDDTLMHVHSDSAPTRGQVSAFDLVRLEKFHQLDKDYPADGPMKDRPSYRAMIEFANSLPEIRAARAANEFTDQSADDWMFSSGKAQSSEPAADPFAETPKASRFQTIKAVDFMRRKRLDWIIKGVLPRAEIAVVLGEPGAGKTPFIYSMLAAAQRGVDWYGHRTQKSRCVYLIAEGQGGFRNRLEAYAKAYGVALEELPDLIAVAPNLKDPKDAAAIIEAVGRADVIAFDTWAASFIGDENAGADVGPALANLKFISEKTGAICVLSHHPGKAGLSKGGRGWSGTLGAADVEIQIARQGDFRAATISKLKDGQERKLFDFKIAVHELGRDEDGDPVTSVTIEPVENAPVISSKLPKPGSKLRAALDAIKALGGPVDLEAARAAIVETMSEPEPGQRDRRGGRAGERLDDLINQGFLFRLPGGLIGDTRIVKGDKSENF